MRTTDDRLEHVERTLDEHIEILSHHTALLEALNEKAERQTGQLDAIVAQLRLMNEGIIRALSAATRCEAVEDRVRALELQVARMAQEPPA